METCRECGNTLVGGHPLLDHDGPWGMVTYEYECGHCGYWWLEDEPVSPGHRIKPLAPRLAPKGGDA